MHGACNGAGPRRLRRFRLRNLVKNFIPDIRPQIAAGRQGDEGGNLLVQTLVKILLPVQPFGKLLVQRGASDLPGRGYLEIGRDVIRQVGGQIGGTGGFAGGRCVHALVVGTLVGVKRQVLVIAARLLKSDEGGEQAVHLQLGLMSQGLHLDAAFGTARLLRLNQEDVGEPAQRAHNQQQADGQQDNADAPVHVSGKEG